MSDEQRNEKPRRPEIIFRDNERKTFRSKKTGQEHTHPFVGGKLRIAHEFYDRLSVETKVVTFEPSVLAVVQGKVTTEVGTFTGFGTATRLRDADRLDTLLELAETRSIARAFRWAGIGVETAGAEELEEMGLHGAAGPAVPMASDGQQRELFGLFASLEMTPEAIASGLSNEGVKNVKELTETQAAAVIEKLKALKTKRAGAASASAEGDTKS